MKIAIIHDYIREFGGAERVLEALCEIYPDAPIYTAFCDKNSTAYGHFKNKKTITSWFQNIPYASKLASPLRFLTPLIWGSFVRKLADYDVVISSASWYITKGFGSRKDQKTINKEQGSKNKDQSGPIEVCYCHTPPRWLYGYNTSINFQKYFLVRIYAKIVGHFLRNYDYKQAQKVNFFIANSKEVAGRIKKFYNREAIVIYPPVSLPLANSKLETRNSKDKDYYFIVSRIVGAKGLELAVEAAIKGGYKLKIAGSSAGYYSEQDQLAKKGEGRVEFLGQVTDEELVSLYSGAKAFLALAKDEDFGITPVESMSCGTPVIAFNGGGYKETVVDPSTGHSTVSSDRIGSGRAATGILFNDYSVDGLVGAIKRFNDLNHSIKAQDCINQAEKFSKERFKHEIENFVNSKIKYQRSKLQIKN
jgi:glycosyltransferase involved in cell wall biosynthesis